MPINISFGFGFICLFIRNMTKVSNKDKDKNWISIKRVGFDD